MIWIRRYLFPLGKGMYVKEVERYNAMNETYNGIPIYCFYIDKGLLIK